MRITSRQVEIINSLRCERLSQNPDNIRLVDTFFNRINPSLTNTLQNDAFGDDTDGNIAYYLIKDCNDNILFFFSLKCGSLYDRHFDTNLIKLLKDLNDFIQESLSDSGLTDDQISVLNTFQEKIRSHKGFTMSDLNNLPKKKAKLFSDLEKEFNRNVTHVGKTYPGIELVHFCANNACDELWKNFDLPHSIGVIVFWHFIVDKILEAQNVIGIQYLFLFAADLSEEDELIRYYSDHLDFIRDGDRATVKPIYDLSCEFMYQETNDLEERRSLFFEKFNDVIKKEE